MERSFKIRINGDLRGTPQVRVIASDGEILGVMTVAEALRLAMEAGLDLVEVNRVATPPVCKLLDFDAYTAEARKKVAETKVEGGTDESDDE
jgi:translation initiation factor IF-3